MIFKNIVVMHFYQNLFRVLYIYLLQLEYIFHIYIRKHAQIHKNWKTMSTWHSLVYFLMFYIFLLLMKLHRVGKLQYVCTHSA